jgi:nitrite reductase (NADH) small subunit
MTTWKKICFVEDIPVLGSRRVARTTGMDVAVFRNSEDKVFALLDRCPHKGGPLSQGIVHGEHVACTPKFSVQVKDGEVFLDSNELAIHAIDLPKPLAGPALKKSLAA